MDFLQNYEILSSGNEAPEVYHRWCGISVLSSAVSRRCWVDQGIFRHHPNLYIILVGDPAQGKSTAMNIGRGLVRTIPGIAVSPTSITLEALTEMMGDDKGPCKKVYSFGGVTYPYSHISMFANELLTLFGVEPMKMINFLTDVWDQPHFEVKTKNKGHNIIEGPFVTLLGCMTPEITSQLVKQQIISGGFNRRCVFVHSHKRRPPVPRPTITPEQLQARDRCIEWLKGLATVAGPFSWCTDTIEWFDNWYFHNTAVVDCQVDPVTKHYFRSKPDLLLKLTMLIGLAGSKERLLKLDCMQRAEDLLTHTEESLAKVFVGAGTNQQADLAAKVLSALESKPDGALEKDIVAEMFKHGNTRDIPAVLQHLVSTDQIAREAKLENGSIVTRVRLKRGFVHRPDLQPVPQSSTGSLGSIGLSFVPAAKPNSETA